MALEGWYYLHVNGDLIYKGATYTNVGDFRESDFVRAFWPVSPDDREQAWTLIVEALAGGARPEKVRELADKWGCTDEDAQEYAARVNVDLERRADGWEASPEGSPEVVGQGGNAYQALAALAVALGYAPSKMWGHSFASLVHRAATAEAL